MTLEKLHQVSELHFLIGGDMELYLSVNFTFKTDGCNNGDTKINTKHLLWQTLLFNIYCGFPPIFP